ncbi:MAG: organomercurial lyase [Actinomycetota bacterium]|nr:organomercurial lyase [Actinomycetota bacterium]
MTAEPNVESIAAAINRARPEIDGTDQRIIRTLYRLLREGDPVTDSDIATSTSLGLKEVGSRIANWPGVYRDDNGSVIGFWGLTIAEMPPHEIILDGRTLWAWCAWDTLFLPRRLGATLDVRSLCPVTGERISLRVSSSRVKSVEPEHVVVSFLEPNRPFDADVIGSFCHYVHFFADKVAGEKWTADHPGTFLMSLDDAFEVARLTDDDLLQSTTPS